MPCRGSDELLRRPFCSGELRPALLFKEALLARGRPPPPRRDGWGTARPASMDDWRDVGGSRVGCGVFSMPAAKSRAAVAGRGPRKPSLTPVVLALSFGGSVECTSDSEPMPPRESRSRVRLRADDAFALNLSIRPFVRRKITLNERLFGGSAGAGGLPQASGIIWPLCLEPWKHPNGERSAMTSLCLSPARTQDQRCG